MELKENRNSLTQKRHSNCNSAIFKPTLTITNTPIRVNLGNPLAAKDSENANSSQAGKRSAHLPDYLFSILTQKSCTVQTTGLSSFGGFNGSTSDQWYRRSNYITSSQSLNSRHLSLTIGEALTSASALYVEINAIARPIHTNCPLPNASSTLLCIWASRASSFSSILSPQVKSANKPLS